MKYTYVLHDLMSGTAKDEVPLRAVTYSHVLNGPGALSASIDYRHSKATRQNFDPNRTAVYVLREAPGSVPVCVWGGWLRTIRRNGDGLNIGADGFWSYTRSRVLRRNFDYYVAGADPLDIARDMIVYMQDPVANPGGDIGLQVNDTKAGGKVYRRWWGYDRKVIGSVIEALSDNTLAFDFAVEVVYNPVNATFTKYLVFDVPRGRRTNIVWDVGGNCELSEYTLDGTKHVNAANAIGAGEGDAMNLAFYADTNQIAGPSNPTGYPLIEEVTTQKDIVDPDHLAENVRLRVQGRLFPVVIPNVYLIGGAADTDVGSFITGDWVQLRGGDGFTSFNDWARIDSWTCEVSDTGKERVKVEFVQRGSETLEAAGSSDDGTVTEEVTTSES